MGSDKILKTPSLKEEEENYHIGRKLNEHEAKEIENKAAQNKNNFLLRVRLLSFYMLKKFASKDVRKQSNKHALWIIKNKPDFDSTTTSALTHLFKKDEEKVYSKAKEIWLKHVKKQPTNPKILLNAARFFYLDDKKLAEKFLLKGQSLEPNNPEWP